MTTGRINQLRCGTRGRGRRNTREHGEGNAGGGHSGQPSESVSNGAVASVKGTGSTDLNGRTGNGTPRPAGNVARPATAGAGEPGEGSPLQGHAPRASTGPAHPQLPQTRPGGRPGCAQLREGTRPPPDTTGHRVAGARDHTGLRIRQQAVPQRPRKRARPPAPQDHGPLAPSAPRASATPPKAVAPKGDCPPRRNRTAAPRAAAGRNPPPRAGPTHSPSGPRKRPADAPGDAGPRNGRSATGRACRRPLRRSPRPDRPLALIVVAAAVRHHDKRPRSRPPATHPVRGDGRPAARGRAGPGSAPPHPRPSLVRHV
ncbi:translation initiation factor IF-2-like [Penaeus monodon]|uniref:translation initiation factor IF-2-like n=1 Tax=Penaeus monodon TaxID=6687 RepID=UPI0018A7AFDF|nr:translation initiation factor IF-2-like [Penaeus monodon]